MNTTTIPLGSYGANCTLIDCGGGKALVVDPGSEPEAVCAALERLSLVPAAIFLTHGHFDHISGVDGLVEKWPVPVLIHAADEAVAFHPLNLSQPGYSGMSRLPLIDFSLGDGDSIPQLGGSEILHLPGHSPGSCAIYLAAERLLIAGDVLFRGSIGRTDLPGGSTFDMVRSLQRIKRLPPETRVICGHGEETTIGDELEDNFYLKDI